MWTLYVHIVPKEISGYNNDKYYFGITSREPNARWGSNGINYRNLRFGNAINKYGWNNIKHIILLENLSKEQAEIYEVSCIDKFKTQEKQFGYNNSIGGSGGNQKPTKDVYMYDLNGNYIKHFNSASDAGREIGIDRTNVTHCCKTEKKTCGYMFRYYKKDKIEPYTRKRQQPILQLTLDDMPIKIYHTLNVASNIMKTNPTNIIRNIKGLNNYAKGYHWKYYKDYLKENNITDEEFRKGGIEYVENC